MENTDRKYIWSCYAGGDRDTSRIEPITWIAMKEFGEEGKYTWDEIMILNRLSQEIPSPRWIEWGHDTNYHIINPELMREYKEELMRRFNEEKLIKSTTDERERHNSKNT